MVVNESYTWAYAPTNRTKTTHLILHHAAMQTASAQDIHRSHRAQGWCGIGYHYYVRKDGSIYRGRTEVMQGSHCVGMNHCALGICFEGNFENERMGAAQMDAGQWLVADIRARYPGITVTRHRDHNATACPGKHFSFSEILNPTTTPQEKPKEEIDMTKVEVQGMITEAVQAAITAAKPVVYQRIEDVPEWGCEAVQSLIDEGVLQGDGQGLNLTEDLLRMIVVMGRMRG